VAGIRNVLRALDAIGGIEPVKELHEETSDRRFAWLQRRPPLRAAS
jgi:hypothetical protein